MRFSSKRFCLLLLCAAMCLAAFPFRADALTEDVRLTYGTNVEAQNYNNSNYSKPVLSYLTETADGELMRVQADAYGGRYYVEYYDGTYQLLRSLAVEAELPLFGAFYATESNYYVLSGQENPEESPAVECFRITKYDLNWKRINSVGVYDCNTTIPFRAGSARMDHSGNMLAIRTCHQMYTHADGLRHQANVTILVDTDTMTVTDAATEVLGYSVGYVSHSFNQFIRVEDDRVVAVDHGDAYPRAIVLSRSPALVSGGKFSYWDGESFELRPFGGEVGDNVTGASVGAFEISDSSYLVAYCSHPPMSIVMDY